MVNHKVYIGGSFVLSCIYGVDMWNDIDLFRISKRYDSRIFEADIHGGIKEIFLDYRNDRFIYSKSDEANKYNLEYLITEDYANTGFTRQMFKIKNNDTMVDYITIPYETVYDETRCVNYDYKFTSVMDHLKCQSDLEFCNVCYDGKRLWLGCDIEVLIKRSCDWTYVKRPSYGCEIRYLQIQLSRLYKYRSRGFNINYPSLEDILSKVVLGTDYTLYEDECMHLIELMASGDDFKIENTLPYSILPYSS
jgi:hypothetical protein